MIDSLYYWGSKESRAILAEFNGLRIEQTIPSSSKYPYIFTFGDFDATLNAVKDDIAATISTIGENMNIRRFARIAGNVCSYTHGEGRIGVLVEAEGSLADADAYEAARDAAIS